MSPLLFMLWQSIPLWPRMSHSSSIYTSTSLPLQPLNLGLFYDFNQEMMMAVMMCQF